MSDQHDQSAYSTPPPPDLTTLPAAARAAFRVPGVSERWQAVQQHAHSWLAALADRIEQQAGQAYPRFWLRYERSYKSQRWVNRGQQRAPIDEYHVAFDRPPRGAGILISISGSEQAMLVGLQVRSARKPALHALWQASPQLWLPIVEAIAARGQARFSGAPSMSPAAAPPDAPLWIEQYLAQRNAGYLWAGFSYAWHSPPPDLGSQIIADVLLLLPLHESLMELAEEGSTNAPATLREQRVIYATEPQPAPTVDELVTRIQAHGYTYPTATLHAYHIALQTRPLVILSGISGMGKTRLTRLYADATHGISDPAQVNPYYLLVAVQPDWHNARDLLGYYNAITDVYHPTPLLRFLLQAQADPLQPYFVCLDELNLARPEYYLAPILSAMETSDHLLDLSLPAASVPMLGGELLHTPLRLPHNLYFTGTVNNDESTYPLTDRLLDRANLIELAGLDLDQFRAHLTIPVAAPVWATLCRLVQAMDAAGHPPGYRTLTDVVRYVQQAEGILSVADALDQQVMQKLLPRMRGMDSPRLRSGLQAMQAICAGTAEAPADGPPLLRLPQSAARLERMQARLAHDGFTDFHIGDGG